MERPVAGIVPIAVAVVAGVLSWDLVRLFGDRARSLGRSRSIGSSHFR